MAQLWLLCFAQDDTAALDLRMLLDEDSVRRHLRMDELIPAMARALADFSAGNVVQPVRQMFQVSGHPGFFGGDARLHAYDSQRAKLVTFYPENRSVPHRITP